MGRYNESTGFPEKYLLNYNGTVYVVKLVEDDKVSPLYGNELVECRLNRVEGKQDQFQHRVEKGCKIPNYPQDITIMDGDKETVLTYVTQSDDGVLMYRFDNRFRTVTLLVPRSHGRFVPCTATVLKKNM